MTMTYYYEMGVKYNVFTRNSFTPRMNEYENTILPRVVIKPRRTKLLPTNETPEICPQCGVMTIDDMDRGEIYCPDCGLVVKASISYVGVKHIHYPYGTYLY